MDTHTHTHTDMVLSTYIPCTVCVYLDTHDKLQAHPGRIAASVHITITLCVCLRERSDSYLITLFTCACCRCDLRVCACLSKSAPGWQTQRQTERRRERDKKKTAEKSKRWKWFVYRVKVDNNRVLISTLPCREPPASKRATARGNKLLRPPCDGGKFTTTVTGIMFLQVTALFDLHHLQPMDCQHKAPLVWHAQTNTHTQTHTHIWRHPETNVLTRMLLARFGDIVLSAAPVVLWFYKSNC